MTPTTMPPTGLGIPPAIAAFAAEQGALDYLPAVFELTRQVFAVPSARLLLEDDPEIANDRHIVFEADVTDLNEQQLAAAQAQWSKELLIHCPPTVSSVFRYGLVARA